MTGTTSRRAMLAGIAATPAIAAASVAVAGSSTPDPIFAAIENYRQADERHCQACYESDEAADEAGEVSYQAMWRMAETVPTTAAGALAVLRFIQSRIDTPAEALIDFLDPREENSITPALIASLCAFLSGGGGWRS
jgi:hypothetical protein